MQRIIAIVRCTIAFVQGIVAIVQRMFAVVQRMFASVQEMYSPATLNIPNGTGNPHSVQLRARYVLKDEPVGLNSDTVNVVTTP